MRSRLVILACLVLLAAGCGGGSAQRRGADDGQRVATAPVTAKTVPRDGESIVAGLSQSELDQQPKAPALPRNFGADTSDEHIDQAARRHADGEFRRQQTNGLSVEKRALYIAYVWKADVNRLRRDRPSHIAGLTIGEVEDQPAVPPLPGLFDLRHGPDDLAKHALVVARDDRYAARMPETLSVAKRQRYLVWAWTPQLEERQARYRAALAEREARTAAMLVDAEKDAAFRKGLDDQDARYRRQIELESRKSNPVLTPDQVGELHSMRQ